MVVAAAALVAVAERVAVVVAAAEILQTVWSTDYRKSQSAGLDSRMVY